MGRHKFWWSPVMILLLTLWALVSAFYWIGAENVRFVRLGARVAFDREHDFQLYGLGNGAAILVDSNGNRSAVKIERGTFPFCPLCGDWEPAGTLVNGVDYIDGEWLYRAPIELPPDANDASQGALYNIVTGERVRVPPRATVAQQTMMLTARDLAVDPAKQLTPAQMEARTTPVRAINESCVVFQAAFLLLVGAWSLLGVVLVIAGRSAAQSAKA